MKNYLLKASFFVMPILFCWLLIILIDPYNILNVSWIIDKETKFKNLDLTYERGAIGYILWKKLEFERKPSGNLLIGDSQACKVDKNLVSNLCRSDFMNMSVPGANMETKFSIFWLAANQIQLKHVVIQLSFMNLNIKTNLFKITQDYINKPYLYFFDGNICRDSYRLVANILTKTYDQKKCDVAFPSTLKKERSFHIQQEKVFRNYSYPTHYYTELRRIVDYCNTNNITLEFVVFPIQQRYFDFLSEHHLMSDYDRFITEISELAKTSDFSTNRSINNNEKNFVDYFHQNQHITDSLTQIIWGKREILTEAHP